MNRLSGSTLRQRKTEKHFSDIKIMQKLTPKANLLIITKLHLLQSMTLNH